MKFIIAGFYQPALLGVEALIHMGYQKNNIRVLTHDPDDWPRNEEFIGYLCNHDINYTTKDISDPEVQKWIQEFHPDILFSLYYHSKIPKVILEGTSYGGVNLHPSILPDYKGLFSISWSIINGEESTGFSYHYMTDEFDSGNIILQEETPILPGDTADTLYHRVLHLGLNKFSDVLRLVTEDEYSGRPQVQEGSYYPRKLPHCGIIDPDWKDEYIERFIRAMNFPYHRPAIIEINGEKYEIRTMEAYEALRNQYSI